MRDTPPNDKTPTAQPEWTTERLDSWKEIASFFRRDVRTVQLWEKSEALPVRRHHHKKLGSVYAYRRELERWWALRSARNASPALQVEPTPKAPKLEHSAHSAEPTPRRILIFPLEVADFQRSPRPFQQILDRFTDGLQEDLLLELRRIHSDPIRLSARSLPAHGATTATFLRNTALQYRADFYMTGSLRHAGDQLRICMQLMRSHDAFCVWTDRFDTTLDEGFKAHSELARKIVRVLPEYLVSRELVRERLGEQRQRGEDTGPAYHACMMGLYFWKQRTKSDLMKALGYYQEALLLDPQCADAYAGLADTYASLSYNHLMPPRQAMEAAKRAIEAGLALAPGSLNVRNAAINFRINCAWEWAVAERLCQRTVDSGCVDSRTFQLYASLMINLGRHDEAIQLSLHAHRLDPLSESVNSQVSFSYFYAGDYNSALHFIDRTIELRPRSTVGHALLGRTQAERGNWEQAIQAFERGLELSTQSVLWKALVAYGHAGLGNSDRADEILREIQADAGDECFPAYDVSAVHAKLNQQKKALENISRAYDMHDMKMAYIQHDPRFNSLRSLPELKKITASIFPFHRDGITAAPGLTLNKV